MSVKREARKHRKIAGSICMLIILTAFILLFMVLASCSAGNGSPGGKQNIASGITDPGENGTDALTLAETGGLTGSDGIEQTNKPVERIEVQNTGTDAKRGEKSVLDCTLTLLTPEGAIEADAIETKTVDNGDGTVALIIDANDAAAFSSVNVEIRFDTGKFNPVKWAVGSMFDAGARLPGAMGAGRAGAENAFGVGDKGILELGSPGSTTGSSTYLGAALRGANHLGIAVARLRPDLNGELSGNGELARIVFERKPYANPYDGRKTSAFEYEPPRTPQYFWDWDYGVVIPRGNGDNLTCVAIFSTQLPGDADGDLEVTVADITPIANNYLKTMYWQGGLIPCEKGAIFDYVASDFLPDLDRNGEIGIPDVTQIANAYCRKYNRRELAYRISGGTWKTAEMKPTIGESNPNGEVSPAEISLTFGCYTVLPFDSSTYEYGISFSNTSTLQSGILPFATWDTNLLKVEDLIKSVEYDSGNNRIVIESELVGDWERLGNVGVPGLSSIAIFYQSGDSYFFGQNKIDYFQEMRDWGTETIEDTFLIPMMYRSVIMVSYFFRYTDIEISYFDSIDATAPIRTQIKHYLEHKSEYDEDEVNNLYYTDDIKEKPMPLSLNMLGVTPDSFGYPVYVSVRLIYSDGSYSVWPERILIE